MKLKVIATVGVTMLLTALVFGWFSHSYGTVTWFLDPPPRITSSGREYQPVHFAPTPELPAIAGVDWYVKGHMWPLGYDIYGPRGYPTPTTVVLKWRDNLFYQYGLQGGP